MNHWIVFIVGLIVAIVVWYLLIFIVGLIVARVVWYLLSKSLSDDNTSGQDNEDDEEWVNCTNKEALCEAVRLVELKIEEFSNSVRIIEHKAIALITLCFAIIGYSYTIEWSGNFFELLRVVAMLLLFSSSLVGVSVLFLESIGILGRSPKASLWASKYYKLDKNKNGDDKEIEFIKLLRYTLEKYDESIEASEKVSERKSKKLELARKLLLFGLSAISGWVASKGVSFLFIFYSAESIL